MFCHKKQIPKGKKEVDQKFCSIDIRNNYNYIKSHMSGEIMHMQGNLQKNLSKTTQIFISSSCFYKVVSWNKALFHYF
jgi:hypothetical protein